MFGPIAAVFSALARLTASIDRLSDYFDSANAQIEARLTAPAEDRAPAIPAPPEPHEANGAAPRKTAKGRA